MSKPHDEDHQKLLDLGVPQHALEQAQQRGIGGGRIINLFRKLLPTLLEFLAEGQEQGGGTPPAPPTGTPPAAAKSGTQANPKN